ncbi:MAG: single-stranded-DNA-specific exonuclease [Solirubrobacteraceae bacterium]|jgi:single-stranded-DNA-specific exonuclease|nr:single-stranded-DNA-specific exonuclease [Solirubrobacteraceae bacterium]
MVQATLIPEAPERPAGRSPAETVPPGSPLALAESEVAARLSVPTKRLRIPGYELKAALALERELGIGHALSQILARRGLTDPGQARAFLDAEPTRAACPLPGIDTAVAAIRRHISARQRITIHGDYDVDGVCATAIMVRALRALGADVDWYLPGRLEDGYGLALATVERLAARGTRLIVTVDCAITAVDEVAHACAAGLEVVVTDHHAPRADGRLPDCPIVHPGLGGYPFAGLCGTAVAHRVADALGAATAGEDLELVALATVADLVPLVDENRRLVREGLAAMAVTGRPGLRALLEVSRADPSALDTSTLGFRLAPRINAAGRMRRADAGLELLLTGDRARAREIAAELDAVNLERRAVEQRIAWEAEAQVAELGPRPAYVLAGEDWHPGVVGIVASRIVERHHRPAVLIALDGDSGTGSGRSIPGFDLLGGLHAASAGLDRYGGHAAAAGLTIARARVAEFRAAFEAHAGAVLTSDLLDPQERVDAIVSGAELGLGLAEELERLEPCGMGNPGPRLLVPGARFSDVRPMGEGRHARFSVSSGGTRARAVAFGCDGRLGSDLELPRDATFKLERNTYNGAVEPRLVLRHQVPCAPSEITVMGEPDGYVEAILTELAAPVSTAVVTPRAPTAPAARVLLDRRGESPLAVLADAQAAGGPVLAVCADVPRRLAGLRTRAGGFALIGYESLERDPGLSHPFGHVVALDPPSRAGLRELLACGEGFAHLAWGQAELRFAEQMHALEYELRDSLVALYRALRGRQRVVGEELGRLLRGEGPHGRSARLAARLVRVLAELELVSLDRDLPALELAGAAPTALERSPSYRVYAERYEDGRQYLSSANPPRSA